MRRRLSSLALVAACHHGPVAPKQDCSLTRIADQQDIARLAGCARVPSLTVRTGVTLDWRPLDQLAHVDGDLVIGPSLGLEEVQLRVVDVRGKITVASNNLMNAVFFPALERAGAIEIASNTALATIAMPRLAHVDRDLAIDGAGLEAVLAPMLAEVGGALAIARVPELALLEIPLLARAASVAIDAPKLDAELVTRLRAAAPQKPD